MTVRAGTLPARLPSLSLPMGLDLSPERRELVERVRELARERFAPRAAHYDATATFPAEDFADLARQGLLAPTVPREHGGLGLGPLRGEAARFGTTLERAGGGWIVDGSKVFATSAGGATWAILLVNTAGPGGARHTTSPETLLMLACDLSDPTVETDGSWWDPVGMRGTVSHLVRFHRTFIPDENAIGSPGQYLVDGWQSAFAPHYAASFLGAAEAA